jgi:two-component system phosphate regulon sensor histidine kinase PhoR
MQATIGNLVKLWSLDTAPGRLAEERIDVCAILAEVRADIEALSGGRHHIALDAQPGLGLYGCTAEIASVARNLAVNAVRYTPAGGAVWIVWRQTEAGAELAVEDNGIGIPQEHIPRITERFYRVDRERSRAAGGSGLGLAIVKGVLARHGAALDIASEPGGGSRFSARFPAGRVITITPPALGLETWAGHPEEHDDPLPLPAPALRLPDIGAKAPLQAL